MPGLLRRILPVCTLALFTACASLAPEDDSDAPLDSANPAVQALLANAGTAANGGRFDQAAAYLERALRIEPQNAGLWTRLANLQMRQKGYLPAIQLAHKSNALAGDDVGLKSRNWHLIADCYLRLGQPERARAARAKAKHPN